MRQQQRKKRLRAGEHRAFGAGRTAQTDVVAHILQHALKQADRQNRLDFVPFGHDSVPFQPGHEQHKNSRQRKPPAGKHQLRKRRVSRNSEQLVPALDARRRTAPESSA